MRMNGRLIAKGVVGILVAAGGTTLLAACTQEVAQPSVPEKAESAAQALIPYVQQPDTFPVPGAGTYDINGHYISPDCHNKTFTTVVAYPTTSQTATDTYHTQWTNSGLPIPGCTSAWCNNVSSLWGIPNAHGFRYLAKEVIITNTTSCNGTRCYVGTPTGSKQLFFLQGIANWNQSWSYWPVWHNNAGAYPTIDSNSHPPYGADYRSQDWGSLWNLAATYANDQTVLSTHLQCVEIHAAALDRFGNIEYDGAGNPLLQYNPLDFFSAAEDYDPNPYPW
jgi:hypothetical protein